MSKRTLIVIIIVGLLIIIAGAIFLLRSGQESPQEEAQTQESVTVSPPTEIDGWRLIRHPVFDITFKLPPAWKITVFENGKGGISSNFSNEEFNATVDLSMRDNLIGTTPAKLLSENKSFFKIKRGAIEGLGYITHITSEAPEGNIDETGGAPNSYVLTNQYFVNGKILEISCSLFGLSYRTMIPTCEEIAKSLQFIQ